MEIWLIRRDFAINLYFEYFSLSNIKLPFQGAEYISLLTQGVALGWYKLAFQAAIVRYCIIGNGRNPEEFDSLYEGNILFERS